MRNIEENRAFLRSVDPAVEEILNNLGREQALCLMTDKPWADYRVLLVTRDRVLKAASDAVVDAGGYGLASLLVNLPTLTEAAVWQAACEQLDTNGLFCVWPLHLDGQLQFFDAAAGCGVEEDAERLLKSIASSPTSSRRPWSAYVSTKLKRVATGAAATSRDV